MSKTYSRGYKDDVTVRKIARVAKKTVKLSQAARRLRKGFTAMVKRAGWSDIFPE
jgi:hypothetical protein